MRGDVSLLKQLENLFALAEEGMRTMDATIIRRLRSSTKQLITQHYRIKSSFYSEYQAIDSWNSQFSLQEIKGLLLAIKDDILFNTNASENNTPQTSQLGGETNPTINKLTSLLLKLFYENGHYNWEAVRNLILLNSDYFEFTLENAKTLYEKFIERNIIAYTGVGYAYCITSEGKKFYEKHFNIKNENFTPHRGFNNQQNSGDYNNSEPKNKNRNMEKMEVFLSYSWDSEDHQLKVAGFANFLRENGYDAKMDIMLSEQETAIDFVKMMHEAIHQSQKVIIIFTEGYKKKAENFEGGVGKEYILLLKDIEKFPQKYILVSFDGISDNIVPFGLTGREIVDCSNQNWEQKLFSKLANEIRYSFSAIGETKPKIKKISATKFVSNLKEKTTRIKNDNEAKIKASLRMEKKILKDLLDHDFIKNNPTSKGMFPGSETIFISDRVIIRSVDDQCYPEVDEALDTPMSSWIRTNFYDVTSIGIEFWIAAAMGEKVILDNNGNWEIIENRNDTRINDSYYIRGRLMTIGLIPYYNIIDYRKHGDEIHNDPHIFCRYEFNGTPYSKIRYQLYSGDNKNFEIYHLDISKKRD